MLLVTFTALLVVQEVRGEKKECKRDKKWTAPYSATIQATCTCYDTRRLLGHQTMGGDMYSCHQGASQSDERDQRGSSLAQSTSIAVRQACTRRKKKPLSEYLQGRFTQTQSSNPRTIHRVSLKLRAPLLQNAPTTRPLPFSKGRFQLFQDQISPIHNVPAESGASRYPVH
jgi:hypothetical protein